MKSLKLNLICISFFALTLTSSCSKDDNDSGGLCRGYVSWALSVQDEAAALSVAASAYGQDPSTANCLKYKEAYTDYINALDNQRACVPASQKATFEQSLDAARVSLNELKC